MPPNNRVYLAAALGAIMLYMVGIFTGAAILGYTESKTSQEFESLRGEIDSYGEDLGSIELELLYLSSGEGDLGCKFIVTSLSRLHTDLDYFWWNLPPKLEVYELENPTDESYEALKSDYMGLSLKAWLLSLSVREKCGSDDFPILYFYSRNCPDCVSQGEILDQARKSSSIKVYTIDLNLDSDAVSIVREAYGIDEAPSLLIGDTLHQGLVSYDGLMDIIKKGEGF